MKQLQNRQHKQNQMNRGFYYAIIIYMLVLSGSYLHRTFMSDLQKLNILVTAVALVFEVIRNRRFLHSIKANLAFSFVALCTVAVALCMFIWGDYSGIIAYVANLCLLYIAYLISTKIDFDTFSECFIRVMLFIAGISLVFFYLPAIQDVLPSIHLENEGTVYNGFRTWGVYARYESTRYSLYNRNMGIFWEPGMYQGYLIMAILLLAHNRKGKWRNLKLTILVVTVYSTGSTTGLLLMIPAVFLYFMDYVEQYRTVHMILTWVIIILLVLMLFFIQELELLLSYVIPTDIVTKLTDVENISRNTRFYGLLSDLLIIVKYPLGVAISSLEPVRQEILYSFGYAVDASITNSTLTMFIMYGVFPGVLYLVLTVIGSFRLAKTKLTGILSVLIVMAIINTEPHYLGIFFSTLFFMMVSRQRVRFRVHRRIRAK